MLFYTLIIRYNERDQIHNVQNLLQYASTIKKELIMTPTLIIGNQNHHQISTVLAWKLPYSGLTIYRNAALGKAWISNFAHKRINSHPNKREDWGQKHWPQNNNGWCLVLATYEGEGVGGREIGGEWVLVMVVTAATAVEKRRRVKKNGKGNGGGSGDEGDIVLCVKERGREWAEFRLGECEGFEHVLMFVLGK